MMATVIGILQPCLNTTMHREQPATEACRLTPNLQELITIAYPPALPARVS